MKNLRTTTVKTRRLKTILSPRWKNDLASGDLMRWCAYLGVTRKTCPVAYRSLCKNKYRIMVNDFNPNADKAYISVRIEDVYETSFIKAHCPLCLNTKKLIGACAVWNNFIKNYTR